MDPLFKPTPTNDPIGVWMQEAHHRIDWYEFCDAVVVGARARLEQGGFIARGFIDQRPLVTRPPRLFPQNPELYTLKDTL